MNALCLNMIVRNESRIIDRCLQSVAPYVSSYAICDTGSTDGTPDIIRSFFDRRGITGAIATTEFVNFGHARNSALGVAWMHNEPPVDYLLLCDADMELVVENERVFNRLGEAAYMVTQRAGGNFSYRNTRLLSRNVAAEYIGVTHEYLSVGGNTVALDGLHFIDHADGANRPEKFERDIRLLSEAVEKNPADSRSLFYLAQSYRDLGKPQHAAGLYRRRAEAGGWAEEAWRARLEEARCYKAVAGHEEKFLWAALLAWEMRPWRAEPLYDIARYYRERGRNHLAALFAERGMAIPYPSEDRLFIEDFVYRGGFLEELSIVGFYVAGRRELGVKSCETLAMHRGAFEGQRELARRNLQHYAKPLAELAPSFTAAIATARPPAGFRFMNPSIVNKGGNLLVNLRAVNYLVRPNGSYIMPEGEPIRTRNYLAHVSPDDLMPKGAVEMFPPADMPAAEYQEVVGFEDVRLFVVGGRLMSVANVRELTPAGLCQQVVTRIGYGWQMEEWQVMRPEGTRHEKNWMPLADGEAARFIYGCDPTVVVDARGTAIYSVEPAVAVDNFRGGSQAIGFEGGWLAVVHEVDAMPGEGERSYQHRFCWFDAGFRLKHTSPRFFFNKRGIEFCAGLAWHPDGRRLVLSYGAARDSEAWIGSVDSAEVGAMLADHARITGLN